jgi:hypothetical protein
MLNMRDGCVSAGGQPWCLVLSGILVEFCSFDRTVQIMVSANAGATIS